MAAGGGPRWQDEVEPGLRLGVRHQIVIKLADLCKADQRVAPEKLRAVAANVEEAAFSKALSKDDYLRKISMKLQSLDRNRQQALQAAAERNKQQMQMIHQMQLGNTAATQRGNSLLTATPQAMSTMAGQVRPPSQQPNRHMAAGPNMQSNVNHYGPADMMVMLNQNFNMQSATFAPVAPRVQSGQQIMQSVPIQRQNQHPAAQLQPTSFARCYPASVAQLQGQPVVRPNAQQNHLIKQNASGIVSGMQQQPSYFTNNSHQGLGVNQQQMNLQRYQMVGAHTANPNFGYPGVLNNQQNDGWTVGLQPSLAACEQEVLKKQTNLESQLITPLRRQVTVDQQTNLHSPSPQTSATMDNAVGVDWREEIFQQIVSWKDAYFSKLMELDQLLVVPTVTEEQLQPLPKDKAETYKHRSIKNTVKNVLGILKCQKSEIPESFIGQLPKYQNAIPKLLHVHKKMKARNECTSTAQQSQDGRGKLQTINPTSSDKSNQQNRLEQPTDASISELRQSDVIATPQARQKTRNRELHKMRSPCFAIKSPGGLKASPTNDIEECCTPSPTAKSGVVQVASPCGSHNCTRQKPVSMPEVVAAASPCVSVKSTLTSIVEMSGVLADGSPCSSAKSTLPPTVAESGVAPVVSPCDSVEPTTSKDENIGQQATPTKLMASDSPGQAQVAAGQAEHQTCRGNETRVAKKKPIDRLLDAVRSSSPAVFRSSVNSIKSALVAMDSVPLPPWGGSDNKLKRSYNLTSSYSESQPPGSTYGSPMTFERDLSNFSTRELSTKRQKTLNAKERLLDEIEAINSTVVDTMISIVGDNTADGNTSCNGGTLIKLSYTSVSLAPSLKAFLTSGVQPLVMPVTLLVSADYPTSSPTIIYDGGEQLRKKFSCISEEVDAAFRRALCVLPEPKSLKETALTWDACVRHSVTEFVHRHGGAAMGSRFGQWESCIGA